MKQNIYIDSVENAEWFAEMVICKPKKNEKIGIPTKPWHHLALIGGYVLLYVWNSREIQDAFPASELKNILDSADSTVVLNDNFKELHLGPSSTNRARTIVEKLMVAYPMLPIFDKVNMKLNDIKLITETLTTHVSDFAEEHDFIIGDGIRVLALPHDIQPSLKHMNMFKVTNNRYVCRELYTGRRHEYFTQSKLHTIVSIIEQLKPGVKFDMSKVQEDIKTKIEKSDLVREKAKSEKNEKKSKKPQDNAKD